MTKKEEKFVSYSEE